MKKTYRQFASAISTLALCSVFSTAQIPTEAATSIENNAGTSTFDQSPLMEVVPTTEAAPIDATPVADSTQQVAVPQTEVAPQAKVEQQTTAQYFDGTEIKGEISGFLKADNSPYLVTEDVVVAENAVLVIEPGVTMLFKPNTGIIAKGQFVASGTKGKPVHFYSASMDAKPGDWNGIFISSGELAEFSNAVILHAKTAIVVENGEVALHNTKINHSTERGVYAHNAIVSITNSGFMQNKGAAVHLSNYSRANIEKSDFINNKIAVLNSELANTTITACHLTNNDNALVSTKNNILKLRSNKIENNKVGYASADMLDKRTIASITNNKVNISSKTKPIIAGIPANPEIPGVKIRPVIATDKINDIAKPQIDQKKTTTTWNVSGSVSLGANYHQVITSKNKNEDEVIAGDTITSGSKYKNIFQVPGIQGEANVALTIESNKGQTIEILADMTSDSWNHFSPNPVSVRYTDNIFNAVLGDFYKVGSEIYMAGLPIFGIEVTASIAKNIENKPLVELNGFLGEVQRPTIPGERNPFVYKNYIEDGAATAQRFAYGTSIKVNPIRRFDATLGFIYANDEIDKPILREGQSGAMTSDPMVSTLTAYADGSFKFFPGDVVLKGQFAVGRADTIDVARQRAINKVFNDADLEVASFSKLRFLMQNENRINQLTQEELLEIFGENTPLSKEKMADSLRVLIREAKTVKDNADSKRDDDRVLGLNWGSQNFAFGLSLDWSYYKTMISSHIKYVGSEFFSAGSPDQLSNTREFLFKLNQNVKDVWDFELAYQMNVENAATGKKSNLFGLAEDSHWGLSSNNSEKWFNEHELDNERAKYIHDFKFGNTFRINQKFSIDLGYNLNYHQQYRPTQLHGNYNFEDGIYGDSWFAPRSGSAVMTLSEGDKEVKVDSARWTEYSMLMNEPYLASRFQECIYRNTWNLGFNWRAAKSIFRVSGRWTLRRDNSRFYKNDLIGNMDLSNSTWGKLGYYFHGADYFEHTYPVSITTTAANVENSFSVTPRFKSYERDDLKESEISITDDFEISFKNKFFILGLGAQFRYMTSTWDENEESVDATEMDIETGVNFRVNHTKKFSSEWNVGFTYDARPDNLSNEYKDIFGGVRLNYVF